ncbi:MAG: tRNA (adenosine(37)-N6)-dimethylallyltransferase MiaA [Ruminococcaceae bacterium]|nr:tRNA (adenosine(37)-N6)-dimethylallyltransferase MiaA [Oscillospiraceae bacterium]
MNQVIVIAGPTASGKTGLSVEVAKQLHTEIVSADSMQIYQGMDVGTAKVTEDEMCGIPHHMIDIVSPMENYNVSRYVEDAKPIVDGILAQGKIPVIAGGTGLYINSLVYGYDLAPIPSDDAVREEITKLYEEKGGEFLLEELRKIDPKTADRLHPNNARRLIRALEVYRISGTTISDQEERTKNAPKPYDVKFFVLDTDRDKLYERINRRVDLMLENGLVAEVKTLLEQGIPKTNTSMQAIGYKEIVEYLDGYLTLDEAVEKLKMESRRYAKRQLTWFRRNEGAHWLEASLPKEELAKEILDTMKKR